jgi:hypothetical protein
MLFIHTKLTKSPPFGRTNKMGCCESRVDDTKVQNSHDKKAAKGNSAETAQKPPNPEPPKANTVNVPKLPLNNPPIAHSKPDHSSDPKGNIEKSHHEEVKIAVEVQADPITERIEHNIEEKKPAQAGGHAGSLIVRGDKLLKRAGPAELKFYAELFAEENKNADLIELQSWVPHYHGTTEIEGKTYLVLDNLLWEMEHPNLLDCKLGKVTWTKDHNARKTADQKKKAEETTTGSLGFRISGLVVKDVDGNVVESFAKEEGFYGITADNIHESFKKIVGDDQKLLKKVIKETKKLIKWFEKQIAKQFFTASVFYVVGKDRNVKVKFIDFAHVYDAEGEKDESKR